MASHSLPRCFHQDVSARCGEGLACTCTTLQLRGRSRLLPNSSTHGLDSTFPKDIFTAWLQPHVTCSKDAALEFKPRSCLLQTRHITLQRKRALLIRRPAGGIDCKLSTPDDFTQTGHSHFSHSSRSTSHPCFAGRSVWPPAQHKVYNLQGKEASHRDTNHRKAHRSCFCFVQDGTFGQARESVESAAQVVGP